MPEPPAAETETIHASCVAVAGRGVLLAGKSGCGKSDLALRLIDRGAALVSDDYTVIRRSGDGLAGSAPATIAGRIEVRGIGIVAMPHAGETEIVLLIDLEREPERMPEPAERRILGVALPLLLLAAEEASAPIKVELALAALR